ncbi:MAG: hypothetical protein EHM72_08390 [Calditrichaeota bacterium]|nr:MAG: hypothetical protein EHM72_08390 [Calditrichota bacterium]
MSNRRLGIYLGILFIFIGGMALLGNLHIFHKELPGALFFFVLFVAFAQSYAQKNSRWWAVVPAGCCFTLGTILILKSYSLVDSRYFGFVFLLGLGLTFFYLWTLRGIPPLKWAIWPAAGFLMLALYAWLEQINILDEKFLFALLLLLLGGFLIARGMPGKR